MTNSWGVPEELEKQIRERDKVCVYCGKEFVGDDEIEHIDNNVKNISLENIAICCSGCNRSKSNKSLLEWLKSDWCKQKNITIETVAPVIKNYLRTQ